MNASKAIEEIKRIIDQHGDVPLETIVRREDVCICGLVSDVKYRSTGICRPFIQLIAHEK